MERQRKRKNEGREREKGRSREQKKEIDGERQKEVKNEKVIKRTTVPYVQYVHEYSSKV